MKKILILISMMCFGFANAAFAQLNGEGFYRVKSVRNNYISVIGTYCEKTNEGRKNLSAAVKFVPSASGNQLTDAGSVIKITGSGTTSMTQAVLEAQGVNTFSITGRKLTIDNVGNNLYKAYHRYIFVNYYCKDYGDNIFAMYGGDYDNEWYIEPLTEATMDDYYFGVAPEIHVGDYYYTTLYTKFAYILKDGVEAYWLDGDMAWQPLSGTVPAGTPVILKCQSDAPAHNRLVPTTSTLTAPEGNQLVGVINLNTVAGRTEAEDDDLKVYDASTMQVLGVDENGAVGFVASSTLSYIPTNTAYLPVTAAARGLNVLPGTTGIATQLQSARQSSGVYYDLQGRRVDQPAHGLYILDGKKVMVP